MDRRRREGERIPPSETSTMPAPVSTTPVAPSFMGGV